jgi:hypothetical protein
MMRQLHSGGARKEIHETHHTRRLFNGIFEEVTHSFTLLLVPKKVPKKFQGREQCIEYTGD